MCGITGIIRTNRPVTKQEISAMTDAIAHRGPDGEGFWLNENVAIGHRRLSIIDLNSGSQPMCNEDGKVWITFNGEIYNFVELKSELEKLGHQFKTKSDTEVIIHGWEQWGRGCVTKLRGMFSFGIVDLNKRIVFLARDYFGIKPLVYYRDENCFAFSSEILALRKIENATYEINLQALDQYLQLQYIPAPFTIFRNIYKLPPAHSMEIGFDGKVSNPECYWTFQFKPYRWKSEKSWLEELEYTLKDSVKNHLISDVAFGAFLSGGVDSSAVVAYMAQILEKPVKTFSIGFKDAEFDETPYAKIASNIWKTEHHVEIVEPNGIEILPDLVKHYGEPYGDSSAIPTYYVSQLARKHVTMVLSGDGGDELFGGYESHLWWRKYHDTPIAWRPKWKDTLYPYAHKYFPTRFPKPHKPVPSLNYWLRMINYFSPEERARLWRPEYHSLLQHSLDIFEDEFKTASAFSTTQMVQYMDLKTYLPFDILTKVDIASMIHSLEVRPPFVDKNVVEFAMSIPENLNVKKMGEEDWKGKLLLRKLMSKYYSHDYLFRRKMGFSIPYNKWLGLKGDWSGEISDRLLNKNAQLYNYFTPQTIKDTIANERYGPIWLLLFLDEWFKQNI